MDNRELNKDGVGLGLTISKNIAQALKGDIEVQSVVGKGSKFILSLPLNEATEAPACATAAVDELYQLEEENDEENMSEDSKRTEFLDSQIGAQISVVQNSDQNRIGS